MNPEYGLYVISPSKAHSDSNKIPNNSTTISATAVVTHVANKTSKIFHHDKRRIATGVLTHVMKYVLVSPSNIL